MASNTDNVKLGVCNVLFDGVNMGYTKGGVEVEVTTSTHVVTVDQFGDTPIGEIITGRKVMAKVPLAETALENIVAIMPGASLIGDGSVATGTVTLSTAPPVNGDSITLGGVTFTFRTVISGADQTQVPIGSTLNAAAENLADVINAYPHGYSATNSGAVVTIRSKKRGVIWNNAITRTAATPANITVVGMSGGAASTKLKVAVPTAVSLNLLTVAKELILRPRGTFGEDDFTIHRAACPGAVNFTYNLDSERIYNAEFTGYVTDNDTLFTMGDVTAV